jgi:hypothetical protein
MDFEQELIIWYATMSLPWVRRCVLVSALLLLPAPAMALGAAKLVMVVAQQGLALAGPLGAFTALGLGSDAETHAMLGQVLDQLNSIHAQLDTLTAEVATTNSTLLDQGEKIQSSPAIQAMNAAQLSLTRCADSVTQAAAGPRTDANDAKLRQLALQIVGGATTSGDCTKLRDNFDTIHTWITADEGLPAASAGVYSRIARIARDNALPYDGLATHFVQYELLQRQAVSLIRNAYLMLGDPDTLNHELTEVPNYLGLLRDEEISFLRATDVYITSNPILPHDLTPAQQADGIVQAFEGVQQQVSTYSLSILDTAQPLVPTLRPDVSAGPEYTILNTLSGTSASYYGAADLKLAEIASCRLKPPTPGFSFLRPTGGAHGGVVYGASCDLHVERHLNREISNAVNNTWSVLGRYGFATLGPSTRRNVVTLNEETPDDALALMASPDGANSQFSALSILADHAHPEQVTLAVDVPSQPGAHRGAGTTHPLVAGSSTPLLFTRIRRSARYPNQYSFKAANGQYLSVGSDSYATLGSDKAYFIVRTTGDGHSLLTTLDGQVLYVDFQTRQFFHGEAPDDHWGNIPNLADGIAAVTQWTVPIDGIPRTHASNSPSGQLYFYPPCLDAGGNPQFSGQDTQFLTVGSFCSQGKGLFSGTSYSYVYYDLNLTNTDSNPHDVQITVGGAAVGPPASEYNGTTYAGVHCFIPSYGAPFDHMDAALAATQPEKGAATAITGPYTLTLPAQATITARCSMLDSYYRPAVLIINEFRVKPCKPGTAGANCQVYQ